MSGDAIAAIIIFVSLGILGCGAAVISEWLKNRGSAEFVTQYRELSARYDELAQALRDGQKTMQSDLAELRKQMDSVERMMKDVG